MEPGLRTSSGGGRPSPADPELAISVRGLVKSYGQVKALCGVDLYAARGSVLGLLGPNGAGKTTVVRILTTLLEPDAGTATVVGLDVVRDAAALRHQIGLAGQYAAVDENLTGLENLTMVGRLYGENRRAAKARGMELLERFDLVAAANRPVKTYSGGMRRRLDLAAALVAKPLEDGLIKLSVRQRSGTIVQAVQLLTAAGVGVDDLVMRRPTLDDVFLTLTGHAAEERTDEAAEAA